MATYRIETVRYNIEEKENFSREKALKLACQKAKKLPRNAYVKVSIANYPKSPEFRIAKVGTDQYLITDSKSGKVGHISPITGEIKWM